MSKYTDRLKHFFFLMFLKVDSYAHQLKVKTVILNTITI